MNCVADLKARLMTERKLAPACVRLLNATGTVGCGSAGPVAAPLLQLQDAATDPVIGAVPLPHCWCHKMLQHYRH